MLKGIDLSYIQTTTPPLAGFDFVIVKASQDNFVDSMWPAHSAAVRKAGLPLLAYHYLKPAAYTPIAVQAARFLLTARSADYLFLDQEGAATDAEAQAFLDIVRKTRECGLYHSASGFAGTGGGDAQWVADYRDPTGTFPHKATFADGEFTGWDIWQYTDVGTVAGYSGHVDLDYMNPKSALVTRLRVGYRDPAPLEATIATQAATILHDMAFERDQQATISSLNARVIELQAQLSDAPAKERERIALAEAERVRNL